MYEHSAVPNGTYTIYVDDVSTENTLLADKETNAATLEFFTVSFIADGGSPEPKDQIVVKGGYASEPAAMTKDGYTFDGWTYLAVLPWDFANTKIKDTTKLYAMWTKDPTISFTTQPAASTTVTEGSIAVELTAEASASNGAPVTLNWYECDASGVFTQGEISVSTSTTFRIPPDLTAGIYNYLCQATSPSLTPVNSIVAEVVVNAATPTITFTTQPAARTDVYEGSITATLTATASVDPSGDATLNWYECNANGAATGSSLWTFSTVGALAIPINLKAGTYYYICQATYPGAVTVNSNVATVIVYPSHTITFTTQPAANTTVTEGSISGALSAEASVDPSGNATLDWYACDENGAATGSPLGTFSTVGAFAIPIDLKAGTYYFICQATHPGATPVNSNVAKVNALLPAKDIPSEVENNVTGTTDSYMQGEDVTFTAFGASTVTGSAVAGDVRWGAKNWRTLLVPAPARATNPSGDFSTGLTQSFSTADMRLGTHELAVTFIVQHYNGTAWVDISPAMRCERRVKFSVIDPDAPTYALTVNSGTGGGEYAPGARVPITVDATQAGMRFKEWTIVSGGGYFDDPKSASTYYTMPGNAATIEATYAQGIEITTQPVDQYAIVGQRATFSITATGDGIRYQWHINRNDGNGWRALSGATDARYTTSEVDMDCDGFRYACLVSDEHGDSLRSEVATLHVSAAPVPPPTGDTSRPTLWALMCLFGAVGFVLILLRRRVAVLTFVSGCCTIGLGFKPD